MRRFPVLRAAVLGSGCGSLVLWCACAVAAAQNPQALLNLAVDQFQQGRFTASSATFDELAALVPEQAPQLWQRGIALYYAGRYGDCRRQFESHRTVNPDDVENAAWHFLCVARAETPERARAALLPVGPDSRQPMREVYQMFQGKLGPDEVLKAGGERSRGSVLCSLVYRSVFGSARPKGRRAETHEGSGIGPLCAGRRVYAHGGGGAPGSYLRSEI